MSTDDYMTRSLDSFSSEYDHLSRSPLCEEFGLGPSGLDRIRQQPSRVLTLPNMSMSSLSPATPQHRSPSPRSRSSSRARSMRVPSNTSAPTLEDLHRFPSESLHSFSFSQQSEELFHSRQNILKRSIDFMRGRFGWASGNAGTADSQARNSETDIQSTADHLSRASVSGKEDLSNYASIVRGPMTGPAYMGAGNVFEKSFTEHKQRVESQEAGNETDASHDSVGEYPHFFSPLPNDHISHQKRELKSSPSSRRVSLKRTYSDASSDSLQSKLMEILAHPYSTTDPFSSLSSSTWGLGFPVPALHTHSSKWNPVSQAVFRTEAQAPWTILAANDLSCLIFGVSQAEVRRLSILKVVHKDHRQWLESKLQDPSAVPVAKPNPSPDKTPIRPVNSRLPGLGNGVTAQLLSKPPSRERAPKRSQTDGGYGSSTNKIKPTNHPSHKSRGVLICGDVVPIQKRDGTTGSASVWVMEKRGGLIWVLEEITENVAYVGCDDTWNITEAYGDLDKIWGQEMVKPGQRITELLPRLPSECLQGSPTAGLTKIADMKHFAALTAGGISIPVTVSKAQNERCLRISSFPHVAGMMVLSSSSLNVISSNSVFSSALFGQERPEGMHISELIPGFNDLLHVLTEEDKVPLVDGMLIPDHSFRRARTLSILREGKSSVASVFAEPTGLAANHRDGSVIAVDIQMRVVKSGTIFPKGREEKSRARDDDDEDETLFTELVYALWITYSRQLHSTGPATKVSRSYSQAATGPTNSPVTNLSTQNSNFNTNPSQPSVGTQISSTTLTQQLNEAASEPLTDRPVQPVPQVKLANTKKETPETAKKRTISDY
ncbi:serine threonine protein kinase, partial [Aspergillus sclerotialis]